MLLIHAQGVKLANPRLQLLLYYLLTYLLTYLLRLTGDETL